MNFREIIIALQVAAYFLEGINELLGRYDGDIPRYEIQQLYDKIKENSSIIQNIDKGENNEN